MNAQQRIDAWTLALHERVAARLLQHPEAIETLKRRIGLQLAHEPKSRSSGLLLNWQAWLALPPPELAQRMCEHSEHADLMRSVSPIAVLVDQAERHALMRQTETA